MDMGFPRRYHCGMLNFCQVTDDVDHRILC